MWFASGVYRWSSDIGGVIMKMMVLLLFIVLSTTSFAQSVAWTGMKTEKLIAISEQGDRGFQYAMLYILGVVDGLEGQRAMSNKLPCRREEQTNQDIAKEVIHEVKRLEHFGEPTGKVVINAYLKSFCIELMYE